MQFENHSVCRIVKYETNRIRMQPSLFNRIQSFTTATVTRPSLEYRSVGSTSRMAEASPINLAKKIIGQQWSYRHHPNPVVRMRAHSLIRSHIVMLRQWRNAPNESRIA